MSDDRSAEQELLAVHQRRLQTLEIQAARFGVDAPAHITNEIADLSTRIAALQQRLNPMPSHSGASGNFRVWVVDSLHRGDHLTITDAIAAASPGDRILVRAGVYDEALVFDKPLELIGEGEPGDVLIRASRANVIRFDCARGLVKNLTLCQVQGDAWAVSISRGRLDLDDCDISSVGNGAVLIEGSAHPRLRCNRIHDNRGIGVSIIDNAQGLLEDNDIFNNHSYPAVYIYNGANPTLRKNRIHDNQGCGVSICNNAQGLLEDNDIFNHFDRGLSAVYIDNGANPTLRKNRIHDNQGCGVYILDGAQGLLEDNQIFRHHHPSENYPAVAIGTRARPTLRRNHIYQNKSNGIWIREGGGIFEYNTLYDNEQGNWDIEGDCLQNVTRIGNSG